MLRCKGSIVFVSSLTHCACESCVHVPVWLQAGKQASEGALCCNISPAMLALRLWHSQQRRGVLVQVPYVHEGLEAIIFTADGDMRQALNNLQATHFGFGLVDAAAVFKARPLPNICPCLPTFGGMQSPPSACPAALTVMHLRSGAVTFSSHRRQVS